MSEQPLSFFEGWKRLSRNERIATSSVITITAMGIIIGLFAIGLVGGMVMGGAVFLLTALPLVAVAAIREKLASPRGAQ